MDEYPKSEKIEEHLKRLLASYSHWTGRRLLEVEGKDLCQTVFNAPFVLVSHGTESDPVLNYGNRMALNLWEMTWEEMTKTPSRFTAEAPSREERARLLEQVTRYGFIDNYQGIRISKTGRRFRIEQALVWNIVDQGTYHGQAATFSDWEFI